MRVGTRGPRRAGGVRPPRQGARPRSPSGLVSRDRSAQQPLVGRSL